MFGIAEVARHWVVMANCLLNCVCFSTRTHRFSIFLVEKLDIYLLRPYVKWGEKKDGKERLPRLTNLGKNRDLEGLILRVSLRTVGLLLTVEIQGMLEVSLELHSKCSALHNRINPEVLSRADIPNIFVIGVKMDGELEVAAV